MLYTEYYFKLLVFSNITCRGAQEAYCSVGFLDPVCAPVVTHSRNRRLILADCYYFFDWQQSNWSYEHCCAPPTHLKAPAMRSVKSPALRLFRTLCANPVASRTPREVNDVLHSGCNGWSLAVGASRFSTTGKPDDRSPWKLFVELFAKQVLDNRWD